MSNSETEEKLRAKALAARLVEGAKALADYVTELSEEQWRAPVDGDGRSVGVVVHHVASLYPVEVQLAYQLAQGKPITGVTMEAIHNMNAEHAQEHHDPDRVETLRLLVNNSAEAAQMISEFSNAELDGAAPVSLYDGEPPLTAQFFIEDHAMRHSYHHLGRIIKTLEPT